ncbi:MAG: hypothetical protein OYL97_10445 [Candidatus Poribacteria bacterium]|nr:hypothetical protein [Candidatus Poribacteria bacterium]
MVNLGHEASLLQKIEDFAANGKIQNSVGLTKRTVESKIQKLIPTTKQRTNAAKFYLDLIERMDSDFYLKIQAPPSTESKMVSPLKPFIDFSDDGSVQVQIKLLENTNSILREKSALIVFIILNGFFSNLVGSEDCVVRIINIIYDLLQDDRFSYKIRQELANKTPNGTLTAHLCTFHAIDQDGKPDKTGSVFNIAREIRNKLVHDDIDDVMVSSSPISLSGAPSVPKLHFHNSFFAPNTDSANTEIIAFCQNAYDETVNFVDECYRLIQVDLEQSGVLPIR